MGIIRRITKAITRGIRRQQRASDAARWRITYNAYMHSEAWHTLRQKVLKRDGYRCTRCPETQGLSVHHYHYRNLGHEPLEDLVTLCAECHEKADKERARANKRKRR